MKKRLVILAFITLSIASHSFVSTWDTGIFTLMALVATQAMIFAGVIAFATNISGLNIGDSSENRSLIKECLEIMKSQQETINQHHKAIADITKILNGIKNDEIPF